MLVVIMMVFAFGNADATVEGSSADEAAAEAPAGETTGPTVREGGTSEDAPEIEPSPYEYRPEKGRAPAKKRQPKAQPKPPSRGSASQPQSPSSRGEPPPRAAPQAVPAADPPASGATKGAAPQPESPPKSQSTPADGLPNESTRRAATGQSRSQQRRSVRGAAGASRKISLDEDFLVEGKLEKPSAYYILRRSRADYDWARLGAKFLPLVLESVQDPLF